MRENDWAGQSCIIVGGGPSLKEFDWKLLANQSRVIVINRAFLDCPTAAAWFSEDLRVLEFYHARPEWRSFAGPKILHALSPAIAARAFELDSSLQVIRRTREDKFWSRSLEDGLSLSSNSMIGALNLADVLGAKEIRILGLDCNEPGNYHEDWRAAGFGRADRHQYESFKSDFEHWAAPHLRHRVVINLNEKSGVLCWPRIHWSEVLG